MWPTSPWARLALFSVLMGLVLFVIVYIAQLVYLSAAKPAPPWNERFRRALPSAAFSGVLTALLSFAVNAVALLVAA